MGSGIASLRVAVEWREMFNIAEVMRKFGLGNFRKTS